MIQPKPLTRRQLALLDTLFVKDGLDEQGVLDECKVSPKLFNKWMTEPAFTEQLNKHMAAAHRRSLLHLARSAPKAATKLVALSQKGEGETTRKACLDIISGCDLSLTADQKRETKDDGREPSDNLSPETASRILAALAEDRTERRATKTYEHDVTAPTGQARKQRIEPTPQESLL